MLNNENAKTTKITTLMTSLSKIYADSLTLDQLVRTSRNLFKLINLCECIKSSKICDSPTHVCSKLFHRNDISHIPSCECCQTRLLLYYLSLCLDKLDEQDQLTEFSQNALTRAKVRDRTFHFRKYKSKLRFRIIRHLNAWKNPHLEQDIIQEWEFDFRKLTLDKLF